MLEPSSPSAKAKIDRRTSEPVFSQFEGKKDKKKLSLFKRRGGTQYGALHEETGDASKKSPLMSSDRRKKKVITSTTSWEDAIATSESPEPQKKPLIKPVASPKVTKKKIPSGNTAEASPKLARPRRPPPPIPSTHATHVAIDTEELARRASEDISPEREGEGAVEDSGEKSSHPCSPPTESSSKLPELNPDVFEQENSTAGVSPSSDSVQKSESMEELLKNLEEFDEVISSQNDPESPENEEQERDFATIPRSELPVKKAPGIQIIDEDRKSKSLSSTPEVTRRVKPTVPLKPKPVQNGFSHSQPDEPTQTKPDEPTQAKPKVPPRRKKRMSQKLKNRVGVFESSESSSDAVGKPVTSAKPVRPAPKLSPPPKPVRDEKKRMRSRLEVMAERQACTSAPVSRNTSPDNIESKCG